MRRKVFERVQEGAEQPVRFVRRILAGAAARATTQLDALEDALADEARRGVPVAVLVRDVVLHAGARVDFELDVLDGRAEARVDAAGVPAGLVRSVALGVVWQ